MVGGKKYEGRNCRARNSPQVEPSVVHKKIEDVKVPTIRFPYLDFQKFIEIENSFIKLVHFGKKD